MKNPGSAKRKKLIPALIITSLVLMFLAGSLIFVYNYDKNPIFYKEPIRPPSSIKVNLESLGEVTAVPLNSTINLYTYAKSEYPLEKVDLYINGQLYQSASPLDHADPSELFLEWTWQPGTTGLFDLMVEAVDVFGVNAFSNVVTLIGEEASTVSISHLSEQGETLESIALEQNIPLEEIQNNNPDYSPADILPEGTLIVLKPIYVPKPSGGPVIEGIDLASVGDIIKNRVDPLLINIPEIDMTEEGSGKGPIEVNGIQFNNWEEYISSLIEEGILPPQNEDGDHQGPKEPPAESEDKPQQSETLVNAGKLQGVQAIWQNFQEIAKDLGSKEATSPPQKVPYLFWELEGCNIKISIEDYAPKYDGEPERLEDGYRLFKQEVIFTEKEVFKKPFELVKEIPVMEWKFGGNKVHVYDDLNVNAHRVEYVLVAYNDLGTKSVSYFVQLAPTCFKNIPKPNALRVDEDGYMKLPDGIDLAYFYLQFQEEDGEYGMAMRVPSLPGRFFLPKSGEAFNIRRYIDEILIEYGDRNPDLRIKLDVWGWLNGKLIHVGKLDYNLSRAIFLVCTDITKANCKDNYGSPYWSTYLNVTNSYPADYKFLFVVIPSRMAKLDYVEVDFSSGKPFPPEQAYTFCAWEGGGQACKSQIRRFEINSNRPKTFELALNKEPKYTGHDGFGASPWKGASEYKLFMNLWTRYESGLVSTSLSNQILLEKGSHEGFPSSIPTLQSSIFGAYDMFIYPDSYVPPSLTISGKAGCVEIIYDPENEYEPGQIVCPKDLKAKEEERCSGWGEVKCTLEGIGEVLVESWDSVAYFYNLTKELIVEGITKILPFSCGDTCRGRIRGALDATIAYFTGLPPKLPDSKTFYSENMTILFIKIVAEVEKGITGSPESLISEMCKEGTWCYEQIKEEIGEYIEDAERRLAQPACYDSAGNIREDQKFYCLRDNIDLKPIYGSSTRPGAIKIRITRKNTPETNAYTQEELASTQRIGLTFRTYSETAAQDFDIVVPYWEAFPVLNPGDSIDLYLPLRLCTPKERWDGKCKIDISQTSPLFFGATSTAELGSYCKDSLESTDDIWVPCTNTETSVEKFKNPDKD